MLCLPLGVTAGIHNTQGAFTAMHKPALTSRSEPLLAPSPATGSPSVTSAFRTELSSMATLIEELDRTDPPPLTMATEGSSATTTPVADALRSQVVTPLDWPGEPIPAKVLMIGLKKGRFLGYAVADLNERVLEVYLKEKGHISAFQIGSNGGQITPMVWSWRCSDRRWQGRVFGAGWGLYPAFVTCEAFTIRSQT